MSPEKKQGEPGDWTRALREAAPYVGLGTTLAVTVLVSLGIGYWVDDKLATRPVFFLLGGVFGVLAAFWHFYMAVVDRKP